MEQTTETPKMPKQGWNWLFNSRVDHYFFEGRALCGRWMMLGPNEGASETAPSNACKGCQKKLEKWRKAQAA